MPVERTPVIPRLIVQMRANVARGIDNTQGQLSKDLGIGQPRLSEVLGMAIGRGLVQVSAGRVRGPNKSLVAYELTTAGRQYADEQMQGAGP